MAMITGLSGNEIFCLQRQGLTPGDLVIGNSVISLGLIGSLRSDLKTLFGGEVHQVTQIIHEGRQRAYACMVAEAKRHGGVGLRACRMNWCYMEPILSFWRSVPVCIAREPNRNTSNFPVLRMAKLCIARWMRNLNPSGLCLAMWLIPLV